MEKEKETTTVVSVPLPAIADHSSSPSSRDEPMPSTSTAPTESTPPPEKPPLPVIKLTKRPPGLPPLRAQTIKRPVHPLVKKATTASAIESVPVQTVAAYFTDGGIQVKRMEIEEEEPFEEEVFEKQGHQPLVPKQFKEWVSFKLEHFYTGVKLRNDSDYGGHCPVPIECGFKRYFCTQGTVTIRAIRELLELKFCKERKFIIHLLHPKFMQELNENMTLNMLATETRWQRKRPLRILFTMIAPKEPPPSLEKEPMPILEIPPAEVEVDVSQEQEEMQVINPPMLQQPQHQVLLTPQQAAPRTPEIQRQIPMQITPQYAQMLTNPQLMARVAPMKRKREEETTPPQLAPQQQQLQPVQVQLLQQQRMIQLQQQHHQQQQARQFNPQQLTPQQLQALNLMHQNQQRFTMPQELKAARISTMATTFVSGQQPQQPLFPVQVVSAPQLKNMPMAANAMPSVAAGPSRDERQKAAILHKLLLQQQQQKQQQMRDAQQRAQVAQAQQVQALQQQQQQQQIQAFRAQQVQLQAQVVAAAQRAVGKEGDPPPAKKMALQEALEAPIQFSLQTSTPKNNPVTSEVKSSHSTPILAADLEKKSTIPVPSPPSPPKHQQTVATPSPPAISPIPSKIMRPPSEADKLKPFEAQVSVQDLTQIPTSVTKSTIAVAATSPPPSLSPVIPNNIDIGTMAKMKNQSIGRTLKETFAKNHRAPQAMSLDGIRAQHVNGELQISVPAGQLELLRNSTIVSTL